MPACRKAPPTEGGKKNSEAKHSGSAEGKTMQPVGNDETAKRFLSSRCSSMAKGKKAKSDCQGEGRGRPARYRNGRISQKGGQSRVGLRSGRKKGTLEPQSRKEEKRASERSQNGV